MYSNLVKKFPFKLCAGVVVGAIVYKNVREVHDKPNYASGFNYSRKYYPASAEYPDLSKNRNIMARNLTLNLYSRLRDLRTPNGFTIDDAIQTGYLKFFIIFQFYFIINKIIKGVDNIGRFSFTGIVAGDTESYDVFKELFDKVILERHNYKPDQLHVTDLDGSKIHDGVLDSNYVVSIRIRAYRNIKGYCFPSFCTRGERRDVESLVAKALFNLEKSYKGTYVSLKDLNQEEEANLVNSNLWMDKPFYPNETSANLGRDWPDARGIWFTDDKTLSTFINRKDHLMINVVDKHSDFKASFIKFANFVKEVILICLINFFILLYFYLKL
jgi:creatine kinase